MPYQIIVNPKCEKEISKACKKNPMTCIAIQNKMRQIAENPLRYKPLKYDLYGENRVHIMKSFVLKFIIDENNEIITFISFGHHDEAYKS